MADHLIQDCKNLLEAYRTSALGNCRMPEDSNPHFNASEAETRLVYFTLPMSLNYQRDSYKLWEAALRAYQDPDTNDIFSIEASASMPIEELRRKLLKHKVALQPNKHTHSWRTIAQTIHTNLGSITAMFEATDNDFLRLKQMIQKDQKKGFPYLSGPKIFNYWSFVMSSYADIPLKNRQWVDIAPDTHITKCSVRLGVITQQEADTWPREKVSARWRERLSGSGIDPIAMHPPLWFWSRNDFSYKLPRE